MVRQSYGGVSADGRRARRRAQLLAAGLDIIGTEGFAALTGRKLCVAAGLNERYFYESFSSLVDVLAALLAEIAAELIVAVTSAVAAVPPTVTDIARAAVETAVDVVTADPRKARVIFVEAQVHPELAAQRMEVGRSIVALALQDQELVFGADVARRTREQATVIATVIYGGMAEAVTSWLRGEPPIARDQLVEYLIESLIALAGTVQTGS